MFLALKIFLGKALQNFGLSLLLIIIAKFHGDWLTELEDLRLK